MSRFKIALPVAIAAAAAVVMLVPILAGAESLKSGVDKGASLPAYHPTHVTGPDKDTQTCPVCKYPRNPAVQAWINTDDDKNVAAIAETLEKVARDNPDARFKAFVVFMNPSRQSGDVVAKRLAKIGADRKLEHVSLVYLAGPDDPATQGYGVNAEAAVRNTVFVYKKRTVEAKFVNLRADAKSLGALRDAVQKVL